MQELIIKVPDDKLAFFKELIQNLGFTQKEAATKSVLTPKQEQLARQTLKEMEANPDSLLDWEEVQHQIDWDAC